MLRHRLLGLTRAEVEDALAPVRQAYQEFRKDFSIQASYFKCTRRFFDAMYDSYTYPMVRTSCVFGDCCKFSAS